MILGAVEDVLELANDFALQQQHRQSFLDELAQAAALFGHLCHGRECPHRVAILPHGGHDISAHFGEDEGDVPLAFPTLARLRRGTLGM